MIFAVALLLLHTPDGHVVEVNPSGIVSLRAGRGGEHFPKNASCLINLSDGKFVAVVEPCEYVHRKLEENGK